MIKTYIGKVNGKETYMLQCHDEADAKEHNFPDGIMQCWLVGANRVYSAGEFLQESLEDFRSGKLSISEKQAKEHYKRVHNAQIQETIEYLNKIKADYSAYPEYVKEMDKRIAEVQKLA